MYLSFALTPATLSVSLSLFLSLSGREERGESESERELNPQGFCLSDGAIAVGILRVYKKLFGLA